ncbi:MAG: permease-like cell division protein FtsX [Cellulosilyticaceae bacterium]
MMKWNTIRYLFKEGIIGLWKNRLMALASAGTIILCLIILGASYSIAQNIEYILEQVETQMGITAYIHEDIDAQRMQEIETQIKGIQHVVDVAYISKEDALKTFSGEQGNEGLFEQFKEDNPLPASFEIHVEGVEFQQNVVSSLQGIPELQITYFEKETGLFLTINKSVQLVSAIIIGCLVIIALLLITNTIKLTVYVRRREINIMKYIGATDAFIRLPFLVEGITIGVIGALIPTGVIYSGYNWAIEFMNQGITQLFGGLALRPIDDIMLGVVPIFFAIGVGIGAIGSGIAIHKHLKV